MITDEQFAAWLKDQTAIRCVLVEVTVGQTGGGSVTRYLSNKAYVTGNGDVPANTVYVPRITDGLNYTRAIDVDGNVSLTFGDLALTNLDGALDAWVDDYWTNRPMSVFLGDPRWARSDFRFLFGGLTLGLDMQDRNTFNIQISDNTQRLNTPVTENVLGGTTALANNLLPLVLGECHNITPLVTDSTVNEYQVHQGLIERIIEVRDNGVPVSFTVTPATGKFRLLAQPFGTVTASVQGAMIPANFLMSTDGLNDASTWIKTNTVSVTQSGTGAYAGTLNNDVVLGGSGPGWIESTILGVLTGTLHTTSVFVKAGLSTTINLKTWTDSHTGLQGVSLDTTTGIATLITDAALLASGGVTKHWGAVPVGNGWWRLWICGYNSTDPIPNTKIVRIEGPSGDSTQVSFHVCGAQLEVGSFPTSYWNQANALGVGVYRNTVAEIVRLLATQYGDTRLKFSVDELDIPSLVKFDCQNRQAIGMFLSDRSNVLDVCNQVATSVGARVTINKQNKLTLVKLDLPQAMTGTQVGVADMVEKSIYISSMPPVVASIKLGYCHNWTVQTTVAGGLDQNSTALFAQEWLTITRSDSLAAANYILYTEPTEDDGYLIVGADAVNEANRRLNIFNTQRKIIAYEGFYHLIFEELGAPQTITHPRFGLASGVTGQIISIAVDLTNPHVTFEVLI